MKALITLCLMILLLSSIKADVCKLETNNNYSDIHKSLMHMSIW